MPGSVAGAMSVFRTDIRNAVSELADRRCTAAPAEQNARVWVRAHGDDVRRCEDGSIDVEFYRARAHAIRRAAQLRFAQSLRRHARRVLKHGYDFICGRR